ncbi:predicted protein [Nematostella vectensis]|uniref:Uncharacterized protein n=1 Tax=Nematostella vectensis TaxID=45351 RepID=A7SXL9_NEMVE|nr:predicted protein [Nematostella vectensis]|eukprot:XP_001623653.1 predicted protein [Nematostella vectensis]
MYDFKRGLTNDSIIIVVSPLYSLINDQLGTLKNRKIKAGVLAKASKKFKLNAVIENCNSLGQLVQQFQMALYHHALSSEAPLYEPAAMKAFTQKHSPGLFEMLLSSITREDSRLSDEHQAVQEQRTVVLLHTLAYFRSQKTSTLQKNEGLFLQHHGASRTAINSGRILGFSTSPRNIDSHKKALITKYPDILMRKVILATEKGFLIVQLLDDFHNILTVRLPTNLKLSLATHMASGLLDIHPSIPAVPIPTRDTRHSRVIVKIGNENKICRGGIVLDYIKELFQGPVLSRMYLETNHQCISPKYIQQQLKELRVYSGLSHDELCTLESTNLIDEFEQSLKSMEDYKSAIDHIFLCCPQLEHYLKKFVVPAPGDWPTWFYQKKLIAQEVNADASFLSVIPEQGPFHVFLNLQEDVVTIYDFLFKKVYKETFGSDLPNKPKPFRISLYHELKKKWMALITEKKVEIWHSVLRSFISSYDSASQIRDKALSFAASKTEQLFHNYLTTPYSRGYSEKDLSLVTGTAADALLKIIKQVGQNLGKAKQVPQETNARGQPKGDMKFFLPTFDTTITSKAMPICKRRPFHNT